MEKYNLPKSELRRQAEKKLIGQRETGQRLTEDESLRLVHELQVHQVELEMQNEQLVQARAEADVMLEQYTNLYDFAPVGYFTLAEDGTILKTNLNGASLLGIKRSELLNRRFGLFVSAEFIPTFNTLLEKVRNRQAKNTCEIELSSNSPDPIWVRLDATCSEDGQEFRVVAVDITERKRTELQLAYQARLLENVNDAVLATNAQFYLTSWNRAAEKMYGYKAGDVFGQSVWEIIQPENGDAQFSAGLKTLQETGASSVEILQRHRDGHSFWVESNTFALKDADGQIYAYVSINRDVTERKLAGDRLRKAYAELEQRVAERTADLILLNDNFEHANRAKNEFLANMSHELRTPLTGMLGVAELLSYEVHGPLNEKQMTNVGLIYSSGQHLLSLINELLDLSKIESGKFELHPEMVSINTICQASLDVVNQAAVKKSIQLEFRPDPDYLTILADPRRLEQILVNLLSNAVKFTPANGNVRLEVHADPDKGQMQFRIIDNGIGITAEDLPKLFKEFVQIDSRLSREYEGTGLGLALVQRLSEMHGGSVSVESKPGAGSCFTVSLPWEPVAAAERSSVAQSITAVPAPAVSASSSNLQGTILLAEDNAINAMTIKDYLEFRGYHMVVAVNGLEALQLAEETIPNIILMDVQMPVMNGLESIRQIRANPRLATIPVIALTAMAMPEDIKNCQEAGANGYLSKPIGLTELIEMIESMLKKV